MELKESSGGWTCVLDQEPAEGMYLVVAHDRVSGKYKKGCVRMMGFYRGGWQDFNNALSLPKVTYWRPIPELPDAPHIAKCLDCSGRGHEPYDYSECFHCKGRGWILSMNGD
jgi:hypothetical protein